VHGDDNKSPIFELRAAAINVGMAVLKHSNGMLTADNVLYFCIRTLYVSISASRWGRPKRRIESL
jgi:hypothetical protein